MLSSDISETLLNETGSREVVDGNAPARDASTEVVVIANPQSRPPRLAIPGRRRRFLIRLATALYSSGSPAARTEYLIKKAAYKLEVKVDIFVFSFLILLSFPGVHFDPNQKIHMLKVETDLNVDKLGQADELANAVGNEGAPLSLLNRKQVYQRLKAITSSDPPKFGRWWRLFGYALSASMSSLLFSGGSLWDALFSFVLGLAVGILEYISSKSSLYASVFEFTAALVVSFLARTFQVQFKSYKLCFFAMVLSALAQLLPGLPLTLGMSEMVMKSHVTGTSRIMYALFSALQINFGIAMGENLVFWAPKPVSAQCMSPTLPIWLKLLKLVWFCGYTFASNVLLNARLDQWPRMAVASLVGYLCSGATSSKFTSSVSSVISAFAVGITGRAFSWYTGDLPLIMVLSGILLLVPNGIGVQGVTAMLEDDVLSGMGFVYNFLVVGLSITLGLFLANIELFGSTSIGSTSKKSLSGQEWEYDQAETDSSSSNDEE